MKIVSQTPDEMMLKDSGIILNLIGGVVFAGVGGVVLYLNHINLIAILVGIVFIAAGLAQIFLANSIIVTLDKGRGQLIFQKKGLIRNQLKTYNIVDVARVELRNDYQMQTSSMQGRTYSRPVIVYQSVLVLKDGTELPLESIKTPGQIGIGQMTVLRSGESKEISIGQRVAAFIGVPFQEIGAPNPGVGVDIPPGSIPSGSGGIQP